MASLNCCKMSAQTTSKENLRAHVLELLGALLAPDHGTRTAAESQIKSLEALNEFGVLLAEITVNTEHSLAVRQLSSLILKHYVEIHWIKLADKFQPPETSPEAKSLIREILPRGLGDGNSKIRSSIAYAISAIAHWDWPDEWPQLCSQLIQTIRSGEPDLVHGAMRVLTEFCRELTDTQIPHIAPVILPELLKIFVQQDHFSIRTRSRAVEIFNTCICMIHTMGDMGMINNILTPNFISELTQALTKALQTANGPTSDFGLKKDILKTLINLVRNVPKQMGETVPLVLTTVWQELINGAEYYVRKDVNCSEEDLETATDSDGELLSFGSLVYSIFDFIESLLDCHKFRKVVKKSLDELIYYLIMYMQVTEEQSQIWMQNPDQFVEDEDEETFSFSIRISAQDLFLACCRDFKKESSSGLIIAIQRHLSEAQVKQNNGDQNWWKIHEACYLAIGSVQSLVLEALERSYVQFDINSFVTQVVFNNLNSADLLAGRALWVASRFSKVMPRDTLMKFLEATVHGLDESHSAVIRISAVRAVFAYCDHLSQTDLVQLLNPYLSALLNGLLNIVTQASIEVLALVLETIRVVLSINTEITTQYQDRVIPIGIAVFLKYSNDPLVASLASDLLTELASHGTCNQQLQEKLLPTLISIFNAPADKVTPGLVAMAIEILGNIVRKMKQPLETPFINSAFPAMVKCAVKSDDNAILQNAGECTRAYISVALDQLLIWADADGNGGAFYIMQLISLLLSPKLTEHSASFAGRLVSLFLGKAGDRLSNGNVEEILSSVLLKLEHSKTLTVAQSLLLIFAHLFNSRTESVVSFLSSLPCTSAESALHYVMSEWCDKQTMFYGSYDRKVSTVALSKILEYGIASNDARLMSINVKGDRIFSEGIRTRSKTAKEPEKWTMTPLLVKIYKLLLNELQSQFESSMKEKDFFEWEEDSGDESENDADDGRQTLSDLLNENSVIGVDSESDFDDDDSEVTSDPINQINLRDFISALVSGFASSETHNNHFVSHLNDEERNVLYQLST
uniref:Importin N-terminal domain-containing protein n=1 Tax=Ciona savignyi TaxID=51511 RepID=H2ZMC2_CIOSA